MCGRYYIETEDTAEELRAIIEEVRKKVIGENTTLKTGEIFPSDIVPVIANNKNLVPSTFAMQWGFPGVASKGLIINARGESATQKPMFRESTQKRRCLIPASNYFEWEKQGTRKIKYAIQPTESALLYMAGLYAIDPKSGLARFVILTRPAAEQIAFIHSRMPVVLPHKIKDAWLSPDNCFDDLLAGALGDMEFKAV